ncbi:MAG: hypothetical protein UX74_C0018G0007 [Parcubacteria group bacterium GW2011_GWA2_47_10b]|nr:MAG: hypothetical protein UX74_C0018G0007 [Parcubacteria group bacterium GW2011_GWA2_47_10b]
MIMTKSNLPKGLRVHVRREKARIRKMIAGLVEQEAAISALYQKLKITYS